LTIPPKKALKNLRQSLKIKTIPKDKTYLAITIAALLLQKDSISGSNKQAKVITKTPNSRKRRKLQNLKKNFKYISFIELVSGGAMSSIILPEKIVNKARELGIDLEQMIVNFLVNKLDLNPKEKARVHFELAKRFLEEGKNLVDGDPVQASEKLYKSAEEAIKALAILMDLKDVLRRVEARGRWTVTDLERAVKELSRIIGGEILVGWGEANYLHVWGFHEAKLNSESIKLRIPYIEKIIEILKDNLK